MANIKSKKKRIVTNERARQRNIAVRSGMRTHMKQVMAAIEAKDADKVKASLQTALSVLDRAVTKGVIHANSAARKKSMLQRRAASL